PPRMNNRVEPSGRNTPAFLSVEFRVDIPGSYLAKGRHHLLCKQVLRLDRLPVLEAAKISHNGQFGDAAFLLELFDLRNDFFGRTDEADLLFDNLLIGEPRQAFQRAAGIKAVTLGAQFRLL